MKLSMKIIALTACACLFLANTTHPQPQPEPSGLVDMVLYSYNRPLQLYAYLESIQKFLTGYGQVSVIYRADNNAYTKAYDEVIKDFPWVVYCKQGANPYQDFKPFVLKCAFESPNNYLCFGVDDIVISDYTDLRICTAALEKTGAYSFFLRLGKNIDHCFMTKKFTPIPRCTEVLEGIYAWRFSDGLGDWRYPNNNDMTIYRKNDVKRVIPNLHFEATNYESGWDRCSDLSKTGLFFEHSRLVNITMNIVHAFAFMGQFTSEWEKKKGMYSTERLLELFNNGFKMDIRPFQKMNNHAPHIEREPTFVSRNTPMPDIIHHPFVVLVVGNNNQDWCRTNLDSIFMQEYSNYRVIYIDNQSTDNTLHEINLYREQNPKRQMLLLQSPARATIEEIVCHAVQELCSDDEIIVLVNGQDWLIHANVLTRINDEYSTPYTWMTYGSYEEVYKDGRAPAQRCSDIKNLIQNQHVPVAQSTYINGNYPSHIPGHPLSFYARFFKTVQHNDTAPMENKLLEKARNNYAFIPDVLYGHNLMKQ